MEEKQERREEVMKILQMVEEGKLGEDNALSMIKLLERKPGIGVEAIIKTDGQPQPRFVRLLGWAAGFVLLAGLLCAIFVYLPVHGPFWSVIVVYSFLALTVLAGTIVAIVCGTKALALGRRAVDLGYSSDDKRKHADACPTQTESAPK